MKGGLTVLEVLVACMVLAAMALPSLDIFASGIRDTKAGVDEVRGTNLAVEIVEQIELVPFATLRKLCATGAIVFTSGTGTLKDGRVLSDDGEQFFHLSPLPDSFKRSLALKAMAEGIIVAEAKVEWRIGDRRDVSVVVRRALVNDTPLPGQGNR